MEEIVYLSVRIICFVYLIFKLWNTRKYVDETCRFLYDKLSSHKSGEKTNVPVLSGDSDADVIGETRFVVLDGNSSLMVAPSTPLESNYIGEEEDVDGDEVECSLPLEKMSLLREEQKELDKSSPAVESIPQQIMSLSDLSNMGDVLLMLEIQGTMRRNCCVQLVHYMLYVKQICLLLFPLKCIIKNLSVI